MKNGITSILTEKIYINYIYVYYITFEYKTSSYCVIFSNL